MDDLILKTSHLILRYQRKSDIKFLVDLWMDEDNTKYVGGPREKQFLIDEFRSVSEDPRKQKYDLWIVELKNNHTVIGHAGFIPKTVKSQDYIELNYYIEKTHWGHGYGQEIAKGLLEYAFDTLKLEKVISIINPKNEASKNVAKKIGMKYWINDERGNEVKSVYIKKRAET